jgi:hypothetical protein
VAGFFEDLVPRLRVLHYHGPWPLDEDEAPEVIVPQPLPLLQELIFCCPTNSSVAREFMGAQPVMLHMPHAAVADMLQAASSVEAAYRPLARVHDLWLATGPGGGAGNPDTSDVAHLLRAAPQLRKFNGGSLQGGLDWLNNPAFTGLVHPWLRSVRVDLARSAAPGLSSLRAVGWSRYGTTLEPAFGFIERHGAALTELDFCNFGSRDVDAADRALACCARLESLTNAGSYDARVWLGLTHLHTLRGVDFGAVSVAAIAAALPRLHTLAAFINENDQPPVPHTAVAGFFEDLVPRLRVLSYHGPWPSEHDQAPAAIVPQPLPLLQELIFWCPTKSPVARGFMGAQPVMLGMPHAAVADMLLAAPLMATDEMYRPLARVRDLWLAPGIGYPDTSDVARLLRAAPQLRKLNGGLLQGGLDWLNNSAFTGLVHPWLRWICVDPARNAEPLPVDCGVQLRQLHFPRLQQLIVNSEQHLVHDER